MPGTIWDWASLTLPTKLLDTSFLETSSDDWFADLDGDGAAEMAVGRLPARTVEEATRITKKILSYESRPSPSSALLVADANDGFNFEQASTQLRSVLPASLRVEELQRGRLDPAMAKARLFDALARGQQIVNYVGHGSVNLWRGNLLSSAEALELRNENLPLFVVMNCLNGYFQDPVSESLAEGLLKNDRGGAVAVWASSGLSFPQAQTAMNQAFYRHLFGARTMRLGEVAIAAKKSILDGDVRRTWILFGDPTMKLK